MESYCFLFAIDSVGLEALNVQFYSKQRSSRTIINHPPPECQNYVSNCDSVHVATRVLADNESDHNDLHCIPKCLKGVPVWNQIQWNFTRNISTRNSRRYYWKARCEPSRVFAHRRFKCRKIPNTQYQNTEKYQVESRKYQPEHQRNDVLVSERRNTIKNTRFGAKNSDFDA